MKKTFEKLVGDTGGYAVLDLQIKNNAGQEEIDEIRQMADGFSFKDMRASNQEVKAIDAAFKLFVYGFLMIIALIAVVNVSNSVQMSVTARRKQYGIMQAVGMQERQLAEMIAAESFAYAGGGCLLGTLLGVPLHWVAFRGLVSSFWSQISWQLPVPSLLLCLFLTLSAAALAVWVPLRRMRRMDVVEMVQNAL